MIPSEWRIEALGDFARIQQGSYLSKEEMSTIKSKEFPIPVFGANGIIGWTDRATYSEPIALVTCRGNGCGLVQWTNEAAHISNNAMAIDPEPTGDRVFTRYMLENSNFSDVTTGSAQPQITRTHLASKLYSIPPLSEQTEIANVLGSIDQLIENNQQLIGGLNELVASKFKTEFSMLNVEKFSQNGAFTDLVNVLAGGTPKTSVSEYWNGDLPWYSVADLPSGEQFWVFETTKTITQLGVDNSSAQVLPVNSTILSARGTVGKTALTAVPMAMNQSCFALTDKSGGLGYFAFLATRAVVSRLKQFSHGSVFDTINRETLASIAVGIPGKEQILEFEEVVGPHFEAMKSLGFENRQLKITRSQLMPLLLSGRVRISKASK